MLSNCPMMYCFVGEQPISNLVPIKSLNPKNVVFFVTERTNGIGVALNSTIGEKGAIEKVDPYNISEIISTLTSLIANQENLFCISDIAFNLTGGTKPMVLAGFSICQKFKFPFCYLQSEGGKSILYTYRWENNEPKLRERKALPGIICLDEYIEIHVGKKYRKRKDTDKYEMLVHNCLQYEVDEIKRNICLTDSLEVDLILRVGNQVGIVEIKTKNKALKKEGIDQLNTAGGREYLGTYTKKFYIADREYPENNKALAKERNITVIELKNSKNSDQLEKLDERDKELLTSTIMNEMQR